MSKRAQPSLYVDQSMNALHYNLFEDLPEEGSINVVKKGELKNDLASIKASIIGESHSISIETGCERFTEMLACTVPSSRSIIASALNEAIFKSSVVQRIRSLDYRFSAYRIDLDTADERLRSFKMFFEKSRLKGLALEHVFDMPANFEHEAKTAIACLEESNVLSIQTLHLYPNERGGVLTQTQISKVAKR